MTIETQLLDLRDDEEIIFQRTASGHIKVTRSLTDNGTCYYSHKVLARQEIQQGVDPLNLVASVLEELSETLRRKQGATK